MSTPHARRLAKLKAARPRRPVRDDLLLPILSRDWVAEARELRAAWTRRFRPHAGETPPIFEQLEAMLAAKFAEIARAAFEAGRQATP